MALGTGGELGGIRRDSPGSGVFGDTWHSPREGPKGQFRKCFRGDSRQGFGDIRHISKGSFGLTFGTRGMFQRRFEGGFRRDGFRAGFRDRWHFPKDGPEGGFDEDFEGLSAEASGRLRKAYRSASGTCVIYRKVPKGLLGWLVPKGFLKEVSKGGLLE